MAEIEFEGKIFQISTAGFVPLTAFSRELFNLSAEDLGSFFDPEYRFYKKYTYLRQGLRHNVNFIRKTHGKKVVIGCEGGIFCDDFNEFIHRTRQAIACNDQAFDQVVEQWSMQHHRSLGVNRKTPFFACQLARVLRSLAHLLRLAGKVFGRC